MANALCLSPRTCDVRSSRSRVSLSNIDTSFVVYVVNVAGEKSRVCDDFVPKVQQRDPGFGAAGSPVSVLDMSAAVTRLGAEQAPSRRGTVTLMSGAEERRCAVAVGGVRGFDLDADRARGFDEGGGVLAQPALAIPGERDDATRDRRRRVECDDLCRGCRVVDRASRNDRATEPG